MGVGEILIFIVLLGLLGFAFYGLLKRYRKEKEWDSKFWVLLFGGAGAFIVVLAFITLFTGRSFRKNNVLNNSLRRAYSV